MAKSEITVEIDLKKIIDESKEIAQVWNDLVDNLERIEKKYTKPQEIDEEEFDSNLDPMLEHLWDDDEFDLPPWQRFRRRRHTGKEQMNGENDTRSHTG